MIRRTFYILLFTVCLLCLAGCATKLSDEDMAAIVEMEPIIPEPEKVYVPVETVRYVFQDTGNVYDVAVTEDMDEEDLIKQASEKSLQTISSPTDFTNTIVEYDFQDGQVYTIIASPDYVTDLRLQPTEIISGDAAIGDPARWQFQVSNSTENGQDVTHLFLRPTVPGISTTMIIPTNYRTYYLQLESTSNIYMLGVRFRYPQSMTFTGPSVMANGESVTHASSTLVNVDQINFDYKISGKNSLIWKPTGVYSDGVRTYIQMDPRFTNSAGAPGLYLLPSASAADSKLEVINYRVQGNIYIVDFILEGDQAFLLMAYGNGNSKDRVTITRN